MKQEKLEEVRTLLDTARRLENLVPKYKEAISDARCDKHNLTFAAGSDMSVFLVQIGLTCYTGYYGSSSCSTMTCVEKSLAQKYLVGALNLRMESILKDMARLAREDAAKLKDQAMKEIDAAKAMLDAIHHEHEVVGAGAVGDGR